MMGPFPFAFLAGGGPLQMVDVSNVRHVKMQYDAPLI